MKILQVLDNLGLGGIQNFLVNFCSQLQNNDFDFEFLTFRPDIDNRYIELFHTNGWKFYTLPGRKEGIFKNKQALKDFFRTNNDYTAIHYHTSSLSYIEPLIASFNADIPIRIIHSHNTQASGSEVHRILHEINKKRIKRLATDYLACGKMAAEWMFKGTHIEDRVHIANNGVDTQKFCYNEIIRNQIRTELGLSNSFVIGHVGRFSDAKNHAFLLDLFKEIIQLNSNAVLILLGDGPTRKKTEEKAKILGIIDKVYFLGVRDDVSDIMQAMDIMVLPSIYEGFPVTLLEAQSEGLPCVISDSISREVLLKANCEMISLKNSPNQWAEIVLRERPRLVGNECIIKAGFDIRSTSRDIAAIYTRQ